MYPCKGNLELNVSRATRIAPVCRSLCPDDGASWRTASGGPDTGHRKRARHERLEDVRTSDRKCCKKPERERKRGFATSWIETPIRAHCRKECSGEHARELHASNRNRKMHVKVAGAAARARDRDEGPDEVRRDQHSCHKSCTLVADLAPANAVLRGEIAATRERCAISVVRQMRNEAREKS